MIGGSGMLLLAAAAGYWVLERSASHNKGNLKRVGQAVGWFVILVSLAGVACKVYSLAACKGGYCPVHGGSTGKPWSCPFSPKTADSSSPAK